MDLLAAHGELGAFLLAGVDVAHDALGLGLVDHGAHLRLGVERVARHHLLADRHDLGEEAVLDRVLDDQAAARGTDFALVEPDAEGCAAGGDVEVGGVGQHDVGRLAAALEPDLLHVGFAGVAQEVLADLGRAGEGQHVHVHVTPERLARGLAEARQDVEHAFGDAGFRRQFGQADGGEGRLLGGLQDDRVAGGERGRDLPAGHQQREVPGHDAGHDAGGLARDHGDHVAGVGATSS